MDNAIEIPAIREFNLTEIEKLIERFNHRINEAQMRSFASKNMVKKAIRRKGAKRCTFRLKMVSPEIIIRYNDNLADILCEFPDDIICMHPYDYTIGYQSPESKNYINPIRTIMGNFKWIDEWGTSWAHAVGGIGAMQIDYPLKDWSLLNDYLANKFPNPNKPGRLDAPISELQMHGGKKYCIGMIMLSLWERLQALRGMDAVLMDLYDNEIDLKRLIEEIVNYLVVLIHNWAIIGADAVLLGDDWGTQSSLMISLDMWRTFFKNAYRTLVEEAHKYDMDIILHSDGHINELIPDFINVGFDSLHPIQPGPNNLNRIAKEFGGYITFFGAIDSQKLLILASPQKIKDDVRKLIDILGKPFGNAFIISPSNVLTPDVPLENIRALAVACNEH
ncbi:MAG: hypothetical protein JRJ45_08160 [Deltaproteobacteria bacterium]|nr:hypothetical protein [Deltaproteobacteria bacterium]